MATTVQMPQLGETVTEGTILKWHKRAGELIKEDEVLAEISTDKVDTEIPSPTTGTVLEILVAEGATVKVGTPLVVIGEAGGTSAAGTASAATAAAVTAAPPPPPAPPTTAIIPPPTPPAAAPPAAAMPAPVSTPPSPAPVPAAVLVTPPASATDSSQPLGARGGPGTGMRQVLSPVVRQLARRSGVDLTAVTGTGSGGRITRRDMEGYLRAVPSPAPMPIPTEAAVPAMAASAATAPGPVGTAAPKPAAAPEGVILLPGDEVIELDRLRQRVAQNMLRARQTAAHVWTSVEVDFEGVERVRRAQGPAFKQREGFSLTYLPFIARASVDALAAFPVVNSSIYPEQAKAVFHRVANLGIAADLDQKGLVVLTVRGADGLRVVGLAREIRRLADKARSGKLDPDDIASSTFTITNPGPFGSFMSAPIINVPNTAILSTDTVAKRPKVVTDEHGNDSIAIRAVGYLGLSWDHRAFDGSTAVLFLDRIRHNLESWDWAQELT